MRTIFTAAVAALILSGSALAAPPIRATLGIATEVHTHRSFDLVDTDDHLPRSLLAVGYGLKLSGADLDLELAFAGGATAAPLHVKVPEASLELNTLEAGAAYRYPWLRFLEPYARGSIGLGWATLSVDRPGGPLSQQILSPYATGMVGTMVPIRFGRVTPLTLVFDLGVGYTLRPDHEFDRLRRPEPKKPTGEEIPEAPLDLGRMGMSAIAYRISATLRL